MWDLPIQEHQTFARNPLDTVVCQLRFHPILKVPARVPDFQDAIRGRFPQFQEVEAQKVDVQIQTATPALQVRRERTYLFRTLDSKTVVSLASESLSVTEHNHVSRAILLDDVAQACDALNSVYEPVAATRLGLRYINQVERGQVAADLHREVRWSDLVREEFLRFPLTTTDNDTLFYSEATSARDPGAMTLRYGLLSEGSKPPRFRLDVDRFTDNPGDMPSVRQHLDNFATDIFSVFRSAAAEGLVEWMSQGANDGDI